MEMNILGIGKITKEMERGYKNVVIRFSTMENGLRDKWKGKGNLYGMVFNQDYNR